MKRIQKALLPSIFLILCGGILSLTLLKENKSALPETITLTRMAMEASTHWPLVDEGDYSAYGYAFSAADLTGHLLYQSSPDTAVSMNDALMRQDSIVNVSVNGRTVGTLYISANYIKNIRRQHQHYAFLLFMSFVLLAVMYLLYYFYLEHSVVHPFQRLKDFARRIACGNLDIPLSMEKNNLFGAFTEAFDLMRTQLTEAREQERLSSQSKKELVASLSHDIKTPVTSIKLISELMLVTEREEQDMQRLHTIYDKAEQIDRLISDLFHASLEELGEMKIETVEMESSQITAFIKSTDYDCKVQNTQIPDCLIFADPLRLEQVIGNLIMNSYKYAQSPIYIKSERLDGFLRLTFEDRGPGVSEDELLHLTTKFFRGKTALEQRKSGAGLGLYIARQVMEKMGGSLTCRNCPGGFLVELLFALV